MTGEIIQALTGTTYNTTSGVLLNMKTDILLGALVGSILGMLFQFILSILNYYLIEKKKLEKEREFIFKKEKLFKLQEYYNEIINNLSDIEKYIHYYPERRENFDSGTLNYQLKIKSLISFYFEDTLDLFEKYLKIAKNICNHENKDLNNELLKVKNKLLNKIKNYITNLENNL